MAQNIDEIINAKEVERIERMLASDDMRGSKVFTPEIDKAADFIAAEFKAGSKLESWEMAIAFARSLSMIRPKLISIVGTLDGEALNAKNMECQLRRQKSMFSH